MYDLIAKNGQRHRLQREKYTLKLNHLGFIKFLCVPRLHVPLRNSNKQYILYVNRLAHFNSIKRVMQGQKQWIQDMIQNAIRITV